MPIKNKYLKYTPEITLEIFTLVWNKLIECGWEGHLTGLYSEYNYFKIWGILKHNCSSEKIFGVHQSKDRNQTETTVQEILGYDPFVKEFVLPEKWCIIAKNDEEGEILIPYANKIFQSDIAWDRNNVKNYWLLIDTSKNGTYNASQVKCDDYTEITFDQFKKYVLKEDIKKDWSKATEDELIEEAKRRYPVGCKIKPIVGNSKTLTIVEDNFTIYYTNYKVGIAVSTDHGDGTIVKNGCSIFIGNQWAEIISLPEAKEVIPEYVECIENSYGLTKGSIYKIDEKGFILGGIGDTYYSTDYVKPSTKEAFDMQNKPKSIEKWSVGSYVVFLEDNLQKNRRAKGQVSQILSSTHESINYKDYMANNISGEHSVADKLKWFATLSEAEEFAKTLIDPVRESYELTKFPIEGCCKTTRQELRTYLKNMFPKEVKVWSSKYNIVAWNRNGYWFCQNKSSNTEYTFEQLEKFLDIPIDSSKQVVHCKTREEWDFVKNKINYHFDHYGFKEYNSDSCIVLNSYNHFGSLGWAEKNNYQILSFQEWCDLNGYVMEKSKFEVGKWYKDISEECYAKFKELHDGFFRFGEKIRDNEYGKGNYSLFQSQMIPIPVDLSEIQQYLPDGHPDKVSNQKFKVGDYVVIKDYGYGTHESDINMFCKIVKTDAKGCCDSYTIEIDRDKRGNKDRFLDPRCLRHATSKEINDHLICIGQIPAGEYITKTHQLIKQLEIDALSCMAAHPYQGLIQMENPCKEVYSRTHFPPTKDIWEDKMVLSIDDEELPMVNVVKTKTVNLLQND